MCGSSSASVPVKTLRIASVRDGCSHERNGCASLACMHARALNTAVSRGRWRECTCAWRGRGAVVLCCAAGAHEGREALAIGRCRGV